MNAYIHIYTYIRIYILKHIYYEYQQQTIVITQCFIGWTQCQSVAKKLTTEYSTFQT